MVIVGPQSSVNERLVALEIVRQVLLLRFSLRVRKKVIDAINETEKPIARMVRDALRTDAGLRDPAQVRQLNALIDQINKMREPAWRAATVTAEQELTELAEAEPEDQRDMFAFLLPGIALVAPTVLGLAVNALSSEFHGRSVRRWLQDAAADDLKRIRSAIFLGAAAGETPSQIARRVFGSTAMKGRDGVTQVSRNHIDTIIRSATVHVSAFARDQFYRANAEVRYKPFKMEGVRRVVRGVGEVEDAATAEARRQAAVALAAADNAGVPLPKVFHEEQFVAVLDSRTTKICRRLDGKRYKLGVGPIPPLHMNCRSMRVIVLPASVGGPLYDPGQYASWIRKQPDAVQVMLLGSTKDNKLTERKLAEAGFQDYGAKPMTLRQIRAEARRIMEFY